MLLQEIPLLADIPEHLLEQWSLVRHYKQGTPIFHQGEMTNGLWIVLKGRIAVERVGPDGHVFATGVWLPGEIIGIVGLWDQSPYPATARAIEHETQLLWISSDHIVELQLEVPQFGIAMCRTLAQRLRMIQESAADTRGRPVIIQVAGILATLASRMGQNINLTHEELSRMIGVQRETVTRTLQTLSKRGLVVSGHGVLQVLDVSGLQDLMAESDR